MDKQPPEIQEVGSGADIRVPEDIRGEWDAARRHGERTRILAWTNSDLDARPFWAAFPTLVCRCAEMHRRVCLWVWGALSAEGAGKVLLELADSDAPFYAPEVHRGVGDSAPLSSWGSVYLTKDAATILGELMTGDEVDVEHGNCSVILLIADFDSELWALTSKRKPQDAVGTSAKTDYCWVLPGLYGMSAELLGSGTLVGEVFDSIAERDLL